MIPVISACRLLLGRIYGIYSSAVRGNPTSVTTKGTRLAIRPPKVDYIRSYAFIYLLETREVAK